MKKGLHAVVAGVEYEAKLNRRTVSIFLPGTNRGGRDTPGILEDNLAINRGEGCGTTSNVPATSWETPL